MSQILVVDDEPAICWGVKQLLEQDGHSVTVLPSGEAALKSISASTPDLLLMDVRLPGISGLETLDRVRQRHPTLPVVIMTAFGELDVAVQVMRHPGVDYLAKPFDIHQVADVVSRLLSESVKEAEQVTAKDSRDSRVLLGRTPLMQALFKQIALASASDLPVLITGESGTGKELVAHWIHQHSTRSKSPYIPLAPIALSPALFESEMFGHVRGAFTGAHDTRQGVFSRANGGTVFLDEIGDLPVEQQIKLLRVLELRQFTPVGDTIPRSCDVRVISATNRNLLASIEEGRFREDLYFRLAGIHIQLPALRDRIEDAELLCKHFLRQLGATNLDDELPSDFVRELKSRPWRGNVRELKHAVEHAYLMARGGSLRAEHLPVPVHYRQQARGHDVASTGNRSGVDQSNPAGLASESVESTSKIEISHEIANLIEKWLQSRATASETTGNLYDELLAIIEPPVLKFLLERHHGNKSALAEQLGWHRATVRKRLRQYGLDDASSEEVQ